jgi:hypothetical protein
MATTVLGFFKHRRNAADEPLYAKEIDGWERLKDNIKFHTMFTPHIADLRAATSVADLIVRVDGHYETMTSNRDDDDISLASITAGRRTWPRNRPRRLPQLRQEGLPHHIRGVPQARRVAGPEGSQVSLRREEKDLGAIKPQAKGQQV